MINDKDKIDEFFRQTLEGYQARPSAKVWKRLDNKLFGAGGRWIFLTSVFLLLVLVAVGLLTLVKRHGESSMSTEIATVENTQGIVEGKSVIYTVPTDNLLAINGSEDQGSGSGEEHQVIETAGDVPAYEISPVPGSSGENASFMEDQATKTLDELIRLKGFSSGLIDRPLTIHGFGAMTENPVRSIYPGLENIYFRKFDLQAGVNFFPAAAFYPESPTRHALQGDIFIRAGLWTGLYLESGAGISVIEDMGEYRMNYQTLDSVGYYLNITSFTIDPQDPSKIILNVSEETLFDSVPHEQKVQEPNRYTYFYIPISVGWKFYQEKRVSLSVRAGGKFCLLINKHEPSAEFNMAEAELISSENLVPSRQKTAWLFSAGLAFGYDLTRHMRFNLEPVFEQYISDPYSAKRWKDRNRHPYMFGLRTGLSYSF